MIRIIEQHREIVSLISKRRVKKSLEILHNMLEKSSQGMFNDEFDALTLTYKNMLKYTIEGINDPERDKIYNNLLKSILQLADKAKQDILSRHSGWHTYWVKQQTEKEQLLSGQTLIETVDDLLFKRELDELLRVTPEVNSDPESSEALVHKKLIRDIFNHLWITDFYGGVENSLTGIVRDSGQFKWWEVSQFISAITISLLRVFQPQKVNALLSFCNDNNPAIKGRALVGVVLSLHHHDKRLALYPELAEWLGSLSEDEGFKERCRMIVLQILRSRETEKLGRKLTEEILPQVAKLKPRMDEKLDLDNIISEALEEDKNPDWSKMFEESEEVFKSFEELTKLQMEGADVYMQAFSNLKHFDFFRDFENWFIPFHPDHAVVNEVFRDEILGPGTNDLAEALYKTPFICNSDKYSLILNLKYLPPAQKNMMLKVFKMELEGLGQFEDTESTTDPDRKFRTTITQYLQDLYRFFKLSPYKKEFEDVFGGHLDLYNSTFYKQYCSTPESDMRMADYLFSKDFLDDAFELYKESLIAEPLNLQLYEKIGYCYQQAGNYKEALTNYQKAELIERRLWTVKKIGFCFRKLGRYEEALEYYLHASDSEPDNIHSAIMVAHCYLDLKEYESALKYYFRIEYSQPGNAKILRPIAWCYFALGRFDESLKYYERMEPSSLTSHDYINIGHLALCMGKKKDATEAYRKSLSGGESEREIFINTMKFDEHILIQHGVNRDDLPIIIDYVLFLAD